MNGYVFPFGNLTPVEDPAKGGKTSSFVKCDIVELPPRPEQDLFECHKDNQKIHIPGGVLEII